MGVTLYVTLHSLCYQQMPLIYSKRLQPRHKTLAKESSTYSSRFKNAYICTTVACHVPYYSLGRSPPIRDGAYGRNDHLKATNKKLVMQLGTVSGGEIA